MDNSPLAKLVQKYLSFKVQCRGHCTSPSHMILLAAEEDKVIGAYCCPNGYVSRVLHFGFGDNTAQFHEFLSSQLDSTIVTGKDLRVASRHGWELGEEAAAEIGELARHHQLPLRQVYWVRYPQSEEEKAKGVFLCSDSSSSAGCGRLFTQMLTDNTRLCPKCKRQVNKR
jgi:hypothetical protein